MPVQVFEAQRTKALAEAEAAEAAALAAEEALAAALSEVRALESRFCLTTGKCDAHGVGKVLGLQPSRARSQQPYLSCGLAVMI